MKTNWREISGLQEESNRELREDEKAHNKNWAKGSLQTRREVEKIKMLNSINGLVKCSMCRRPGVLVLVNDCDWELSGQLDTMLEEKDVVVFISTLHGG
ncbi:hypothetical protein RHMOL_Rhmol07G0024600 [Rhododendron molle]|uniref:Uncharacterized protein n=1 Tax=Rhododendron molle TaxID=49168 RepID=A0ACC0MW30_RHOML|nr:hypothetical protein RHMOL_Rhmol07G0024600 [Rhododendron molle]